MELEKMYDEYANFVKRYEKMIDAVNDLIRDKSIDGFQLRVSDRTSETVVFSLKHENHEVKGTLTLKEIFVFLNEENYCEELIKQGVCDLILQKAKDRFIAKLYQRK